MSIVSIISQIPVILIGIGLEGDFSARSIMCAQALADILKRSIVTYAGVCSPMGNCVWQLSQLGCKVAKYLVFVFFLLPDWLMVVVAADRLVALHRPIWYKDICTTRAGWLPIVFLLVVFSLAAIPNFTYGQLVEAIPICLLTNEVYNESVTILGLPALALVALMTAQLLHAVNTKTRNLSNQQANNKTVNRALILNCAIFTLFSCLHYGLLFGSHANSGTPAIIRIIISQVAGSIGVAVKTPCYLAMKTMRHAFLRSLGVNKGGHQGSWRQGSGVNLQMSAVNGNN